MKKYTLLLSAGLAFAHTSFAMETNNTPANSAQPAQLGQLGQVELVVVPFEAKETDNTPVENKKSDTKFDISDQQSKGKGFRTLLGWWVNPKQHAAHYLEQETLKISDVSKAKDAIHYAIDQLIKNLPEQKKQAAAIYLEKFLQAKRLIPTELDLHDVENLQAFFVECVKPKIDYPEGKQPVYPDVDRLKLLIATLKKVKEDNTSYYDVMQKEILDAQKVHIEQYQATSKAYERLIEYAQALEERNVSKFQTNNNNS